METTDLLNVDTFSDKLAKTSNKVRLFRAAKRLAEKKLQNAFYHHEPIANLLKMRSWLIDQLLINAWCCQNLPSNDSLCLIASGGYGRGELQPYSDIDVMIIGTRQTIKNHERALEQFIALLWDIGLNIGQSVRTLEECENLAKQDITIYTNLLDARYLFGNQEFYQRFEVLKKPEGLWTSAAFLCAKLIEQKNRYKKYRNSSYNLEPNIKESPGGLRDLQLILWIAKQRFGIQTQHDLVTHGFLTENEYAIVHKGQNFLWHLRSALHYLTKRHEEKLLFDYQAQLTKQYGYQDLPHELAVEQFMRNYFRNVKEVNELNDMLVQLFQEMILQDNTEQPTVIINERFQQCNQIIQVRNNEVFQQSPSALLEIFLIMTRHPEIKGVKASTIRLIREHRHLIDSHFRADPNNRALFIQIFQQSGNVAKQLRYMSRYGILGNYLPAFGELIGKMQYDLYHIYTVDRHLIAIVKTVYFFTQEESQKLFPLCHEIIKTLPRLDLLYIAALFHDIGKGHGGDHSEIGAKEVMKFCSDHGIDSHETELVTWLVRYHLLMSNTAQRTDIYDPEVIRHFSEQVSTQHYLDYLYLLTCADIYATNERLWNSWRASLLKDLYLATKNFLSHQDQSKLGRAVIIHHSKQQTLNLLSDISLSDIEHLWEQWGKHYFLHHSPENIAWHTQAILQHKSPYPLVLISSYRNHGGTEIFVYAHDRNYFFAQTTTLLDKLELNIVEAQVITTKDGYTLDSYIVIDKEGQAITDKRKIEQLTQILTKQLKEGNQKPILAKRRASRRLRYFNFPTQIQFRSAEKRAQTAVEIICADRPGLLARIAMAFVETHVRLQNAHISTMGERVEDVFYITDVHFQPIDDLEQQAEITKKILHFLQLKE